MRLYTGIWGLIGLLVALSMSLSWYLGAGHDDTYITLWAAKQLAAGRGLVNVNYESGEISSSLLHTLILAGVALIAPAHLYLINKLLGLVAGLAVLTVIFAWRRVWLPERHPLAAFVLTISILATFPAWLYWNLGGLETSIQGLLLLVVCLAHIAHWRQPSAGTEAVLIAGQCLYVLVRPEGFSIIALSLAVLAVAALVQRQWLWSSTRILSAPALLFVGLVAWRFLVFGQFFPNPVYAKVSPSEDVLVFGLVYLERFYTSSLLSAVLGITTLIGGVATLRQLLPAIAYGHLPPDMAIRRLPLLAAVVLNHAFIVAVGGDWMGLFRFVAPVVPLMAIMAADVIMSGLPRNLLALSSFKYLEKNCNKYACKQYIAKLFSRKINSNELLASLLIFLAATLIVFNLDQRDYAHQDRRPGMSLQGSLQDAIPGPSETLQERIVSLNRPHRRDLTQLLPFVVEQLPTYLPADGSPLVIVTYQLGWFPYTVRERYPSAPIRFVDTFGLNDAAVARLPMKKGPFGLSDGGALDRILTGHAGSLSGYVLAQ